MALTSLAACDAGAGTSSAGSLVQRTEPSQPRADGPDGLGLVPQLVRDVSASVVAIRVATPQQQGDGSGVIVDGGPIVTNYHVVQDAADVIVVLADGTRLAPDVVATDAFTDLALLGIDRDDRRELPSIRQSYTSGIRSRQGGLDHRVSKTEPKGSHRPLANSRGHLARRPPDGP